MCFCTVVPSAEAPACGVDRRPRRVAAGMPCCVAGYRSCASPQQTHLQENVIIPQRAITQKHFINILGGVFLEKKIPKTTRQQWCFIFTKLLGDLFVDCSKTIVRAADLRLSFSAVFPFSVKIHLGFLLCSDTVCRSVFLVDALKLTETAGAVHGLLKKRVRG